VKRRVSSPEIDMKKTAAKFVSAIFASVVASSSLTAAPDGEEKEKPADRCLLGPSASTPPGGHWYYRFDRVNKRNCWYVGEGKERATRKPLAEEDSVPAEKTVAPPKKPAATAQRSMSDARAELPSPQTPLDQDARPVATQRSLAAPADLPRSDNSQASDTDAGKAVTTRWPDPSAVGIPASPPPAPAAPVTRPAEAQATPMPPPARTVATAPPVPAVAAQGAAEKPLSLPMMLTVLAGALSVLGVIGSAMFGGGHSRPKRLSRSAPMPPLDFPERPRASDDPRRRIEQMMAQINRRSAA
jgi:hypothetical protein